MQEADGTALLDMLVRSTQATQIGSVVGPAKLMQPMAWRVAQPAHLVHVSALPYHLLAIHLRGPACARSRFAGTRTIERLTKPGDVTTLPAGCDWVSELQSEVDFLHVLLPAETVAQVAQFQADDRSPVQFTERLASVNAAVERLGIQLLVAINDGVERGTLAVDELAGNLIEACLVTPQNPAPGNSKGGLTPSQIRRAIDYMRANLANDVSLHTLAAAVGLSPYHFARCFRLSVGEPPHRFLTRLRINRAKELLGEAAVSILDVAIDSGFNDQARLSKVFSSQLGVPPGEYRRIIAV